jgi:drug/metabolite transporter (DMT)-like permease
MACGIILTKPVVEEQGLLTVVFIRLAAATLGQLAWAGITGNLMRVAAEFRKPLPWPHMLAGTMLGAYLAMIVWIGGYKYTDASIAAVLNKTSVFWVLIFAALFLKEAADWRRWLGAGLGFAGVVVLVVLGGP